ALRAKSTIDTITPTMTPRARLLVGTTTTTVMTMTRVSVQGSFLTVFGEMLRQSKVTIDTKIITATSAAMGIIPTMSPRATHKTIRNTPAKKVEIRVRAPDLTLIMVWPDRKTTRLNSSHVSISY